MGDHGDDMYELEEKMANGEFADKGEDPPEVTEKRERKDKYWICDDCAVARGWKCEASAVTAIKGLCGHCDREDETTLIPTCDYSGPGKRGCATILNWETKP